MSGVSERVLDASPPVGDDREARSLILAALACLKDGRSGVSPRPAQRVAPSPAMSTDVAEERDSQPAQRDELAHSQTVPIVDGGFYLSLSIPHLQQLRGLSGRYMSSRKIFLCLTLSNGKCRFRFSWC